MSTHPSGERGGGAVGLPDVVPFDAASLTPLGSELGSRVVSEASSTRLGAWDYGDATWRLTAFEVTTNTVVVRITTPVGRRRFYCAAEMDFESLRPALEGSSGWARTVDGARR